MMSHFICLFSILLSGSLLSPITFMEKIHFRSGIPNWDEKVGHIQRNNLQGAMLSLFLCFTYTYREKGYSISVFIFGNYNSNCTILSQRKGLKACCKAMAAISYKALQPILTGEQLGHSSVWILKVYLICSWLLYAYMRLLGWWTLTLSGHIYASMGNSFSVLRAL